MAIEVLGPLFHSCRRCGSICEGSDVAVRESERAMILQHAVSLGIEDPLQGTLLRRAEGRCVFLGADRGCRIHAQFGEDQKPLVCRQYPLTALRVGGDVRVAVDPGCLHAWRSAQGGPEAQSPSLIVSKVDQPPGWDTRENALVDGLDGCTFGQVLSAWSAEPPAKEGYPPRFVARLLRHLHQSGFGGRVAHPTTAPVLRTTLAPVFARLEQLDPEAPGAWPLTPEQDAWLVETLRRFVWMRLAPALSPEGRGLVVAMGGVLCAFGAGADFGPALAAFTRAVRVDGVLLIPSSGVIDTLLGRVNR